MTLDCEKQDREIKTRDSCFQINLKELQFFKLCVCITLVKIKYELNKSDPGSAQGSNSQHVNCVMLDRLLNSLACQFLPVKNGNGSGRCSVGQLSRSSEPACTEPHSAPPWSTLCIWSLLSLYVLPITLFYSLRFSLDYHVTNTFQIRLASQMLNPLYFAWNSECSQIH